MNPTCCSVNGGSLTTNNVNSPFKVEPDTAVEQTTVVTLDTAEGKHENTKKGKSAGNIF